jgi:hypothetical protein
VVYALGNMFSASEVVGERASEELNLAYVMAFLLGDACVMVRKELVIALSRLIASQIRVFSEMLESLRRTGSKVDDVAHVSSTTPGETNEFYYHIWIWILELKSDPHRDVARLASHLVSVLEDYAEKNSGLLGTAESSVPLTGPASHSSILLFSSYYEWCARCLSLDGIPREVITRSLLPKADNNTSIATRYLASKRIRQRNFMTLANAAARTYPAAGTRRFETENLQLEINPECAVKLRFHAFEPYLVSAVTNNRIMVWQLGDGRMTHAFDNGPASANVNSLEMINEHDESFLAVGSSDGMMRIWSNWQGSNGNHMRLVAAWNAAPELRKHSQLNMGVPLTPSKSKRTVGSAPSSNSFVSCWMKYNGWMLAGGDSMFIRVWDAVTELCHQNVPTCSEGSVVSLTEDDSSHYLFYSGCTDGIVRRYDARVDKAMVQSLAAPGHGRLVRMTLRPVDGTIVCGYNKAVCIWDLRKNGVVKTVKSHDSGVSMFDAHRYAPLFACATRNNCITVYNLDGQVLGTTRYHDGFLGQPIARVNDIVFHPQQAYMSAAFANKMLSVYSND